MLVGIFHECRVDFHFTNENRLQLFGHFDPGGDSFVAISQHGIRWDDADLLLAGEGFLPQLVPALVESALILLDPITGYMVRRVGGAWCKVDEKGLIRCERLLLADPLDRLGGHVVDEVVALCRGLVDFDRTSALVKRRIPLVAFTA